MSVWSTIVICCCVALLVYTCRKEWLRVNTARRGWRIVASVVAVGCLAALALPIQLVVHNTDRKTWIVLTTGADTLRASSIRQQQGNTRVVSKEAFLALHPPVSDSVVVLGYGFSEDELGRMGDRPIRFEQAAAVGGIIHAGWRQQVTRGEPMVLQGRYANLSNASVTLLFSGLNTVFDSVTIAARETSSFRLQCIPRQNGKAVYHLYAVRGRDTLERNPVPVLVTPPQRMRVMVLAGAPDFENRFLKDWLSREGYVAMVKTTTSMQKTDRASFNTQRVVPDRLQGDALDSVDVLIGDEVALARLSAAEREDVYRQVSVNGMGLIIRGDTITSDSGYGRLFALYAPNGKMPSRLSLSFEGELPGGRLLPVTDTRFIRSGKGVQALVKDSAQRMVASMAVEGKGRLVFNTLNATYPWLLMGEEKNYHSFWNLLLRKVSRRSEGVGVMESVPMFAHAGQEVKWHMKTLEDTVPSVLSEGRQLSPAADPIAAGKWEVSVWPEQAGWQHPVGVQGKPNDWYVFEKNDWPQVRAAERIRVTQTYAQSHTKRRDEAVTGTERERKPVSLFWFFLPLIISSSFLWLERKIS